MDPELKLMLNQTVIVEQFISNNGVGEATYASPVTLPCYLYGEVVMVRTVHNTDELSNLRVFIDGQGLQPGPFDRLTPSFPGLPMPIKHIQHIYDENGLLDTTVIFL